jgi:hypothetical protein
MIVDYSDIQRLGAVPNETNSVLIVDSHAVLAFPVSLELLE